MPRAAAVGFVSLLHIGHSMGITDFVNLNFSYASGAAIRISGLGGGCLAGAASHDHQIAAVRLCLLP